MGTEGRGLVDDFGDGVAIGDKHYRAWVGPPEYYDKIGALQFNALTSIGLRETHKLLDVGCGSLRGGRLSVMYLRPGNYFGMEPTAWALDDGKQAHLGAELIAMKRPTFSNDGNFTLTTFGEQFDFIMVHSVFTHAAMPQIQRCFSEARKVMKPTSVLLATFLEGEKDHEGSEWVYPWVTQFTRDGIAAAAKGAGLKCVHLDWPHPFDQRWFVVVDPSNAADFARSAREQYTYEAYLQEELEHYSGEGRKPFARYLLEELEVASRGTRKLPR
jgi:ubiquinone/menaquinone biosynthesis C-methylase UbiE